MGLVLNRHLLSPTVTVGQANATNGLPDFRVRHSRVHKAGLQAKEYLPTRAAGAPTPYCSDVLMPRSELRVRSVWHLAHPAPA